MIRTTDAPSPVAQLQHPSAVAADLTAVLGPAWGRIAASGVASAALLPDDLLRRRITELEAIAPFHRPDRAERLRACRDLLIALAQMRTILREETP